MDLGPSARTSEYLSRVTTFMDAHVYPAEPTYAEQRRTLTEQGTPHHLPPVVEELKEVARSRGLWNLFLPESTDPRTVSPLPTTPTSQKSPAVPSRSRRRR